jgi:hypothetical protein
MHLSLSPASLVLFPAVGMASNIHNNSLRSICTVARSDRQDVSEISERTPWAYSEMQTEPERLY